MKKTSHFNLKNKYQRITLSIFILLCFSLSSCATVSIYLDKNLRKPNTVLLPVKQGNNSGFGIGGIMLNSGTLFSFSNRYSIHPFPITLTTPLPSLLGPGKKNALTFKTQNEEQPIFYSDINFGSSKTFFNQAFPNLNLKFSFAVRLCIGTINLNGNQVFFFVINPDGKSRPGETEGYIKFNNKEIKIEGINKTDQENAIENHVVYGYQFRYRGKIVSAVDIGYQKKIWLKKNIPNEISDAIAAVCASLIDRKKQ